MTAPTAPSSRAGDHDRQKTADQLGHSTSFLYDPEGHRIELINRNAESLLFTYDDAGQLVQKELPEGDITTYAYDVVGNLALADNSEAELTFIYDARSRLTQVEQAVFNEEGGDPFTSVITYEYDAANNRAMMETPTGTVEYLYDQVNRVTQITNMDQNATWTFDLDPLSRVAIIQLPNGTETLISYDSAGQILTISHEADGTPFSTLSYDEYDGAGNSTLQTLAYSAATWNRSFDYDALYRLATSGINDIPGASLTDATYDVDDANRLLSDDMFDYG